MSLFGRMMASVGIGSAKVDTRLESNEVEPGGLMKGVVVIRGGSVEQEVGQIYLYLVADYIAEVNDTKVRRTAEVGQFRIGEPFTIKPGEVREFPFSATAPLHLPVTTGSNGVYLKTGLDISNAVDPSDADRVEVRPHPYVRTVLDAVSSLGFRLRKVATEEVRRGRLPFMQEFEFAPSGEFRGSLDELELSFAVDPDGVDILMQVDRRARGLSSMFAEAMGGDESFIRLRMEGAQLRRGPAAVADELRAIIRRYAH